MIAYLKLDKQDNLKWLCLKVISNVSENPETEVRKSIVPNLHISKEIWQMRKERKGFKVKGCFLLCREGSRIHKNPKNKSAVFSVCCFK